MKTIKQLREQQVIAKLQNSDDKIQRLVNEGLLDESKIALLKRALKKEEAKLSNAEYRVLKEAFDMLASQQLDEFAQFTMAGDIKADPFANKFSKQPSEKLSGLSAASAPQILVLKRKAIRVFPEGLRVAIYYSKELDKYISVPFSRVGISESRQTDAARAKLKDLTRKNAIARNKAGYVANLDRKPRKGKDDRNLNQALDDTESEYKSNLSKMKDVTGRRDIDKDYIAQQSSSDAYKVGQHIRSGVKNLGRKAQIAKQSFGKEVRRAVQKGAKAEYQSLRDRVKNKFNVNEETKDVEAYESFRSRVNDNREQMDEWAGAVLAGAAKAGAKGAMRLGAKALKGAGRLALTAAARGASSAGGHGSGKAGDSENLRDKWFPEKEKPKFDKKIQTDDPTDNKDENERDPLERTKEIKQGRENTAIAKAAERENKKAKQAKQTMNENILEKLQTINEETMIHYPDKSVMVNKALADKILETYNHLNTKNKRIVEQMLQTDSKSFRKMVNFISRYQ